MVLLSPFFPLSLFLSLHVVPLFLFLPSDGLSCAAVPVILPLHVGKKQRRFDNRPTFLSLKKTGRERRKNKTHQHKQMRPCTASRTSSSLMDTSCPSIPPPPPPLPQPLHPRPARLPRPHRHPTANTMKSWRTCPAPGQWTAMKEAPMGTVVEPGSPKCTAAAVLTTITTNPGTGASPGGRARAGAKLTPTPWESRWPQTVGKSVLCMINPFACSILIM